MVRLHDTPAPSGGDQIKLTDPQTARPKLIWINLLLTLALMAMLVMAALPCRCCS